MRIGRVIATSLSLGFSAALLATACSDETIYVECDGSTPDTGLDSRPDVPVGDAPSEAQFQDVTQDVPDGRFVDVIVPDGKEQFPDTNLPEAPPPFDAGPPDPIKFTDQVTGQFCARLGGCCIALKYSPTFDTNKCADALNNNLIPYGLFGIPTIFKSKLAGGNINFDSKAGEVCLGLIKTFACQSFASADWIELNRQCLAAMKGKIALNATGCTSAVECAQPAMCDVSGGSPGVCKPLLASGVTCTDSYQCGDGLTGIPRYCSNVETGAPSGICKNQLATGAECFGYPQECLSQLCEPDVTSSTEYRCKDQAQFTNGPICIPFQVTPP